MVRVPAVHYGFSFMIAVQRKRAVECGSLGAEDESGGREVKVEVEVSPRNLERRSTVDVRHLPTGQLCSFDERTRLEASANPRENCVRGALGTLPSVRCVFVLVSSFHGL